MDAYPSNPRSPICGRANLSFFLAYDLIVSYPWELENVVRIVGALSLSARLGPGTGGGLRIGEDE